MKTTSSTVYGQGVTIRPYERVIFFNRTSYIFSDSLFGGFQTILNHFLIYMMNLEILPYKS